MYQKDWRGYLITKQEGCREKTRILRTAVTQDERSFQRITALNENRMQNRPGFVSCSSTRSAKFPHIHRFSITFKFYPQF